MSHPARTRVLRRLTPLVLATCLLAALAPAAAFAPPAPPLLFRRAVYGNLGAPLFATGDGTGRFYVVARGGKIFTAASPEAPLTTFLDVSAKTSSPISEEGLLGLAFSPNYAVDRHFWVYYTTTPSTAAKPGATMVARFTRNAVNPAIADPSSESTVLTFARPFQNHDGGMLAFGPDGMLYVGSGDGGSSGDPGNRAQNRSTLFGKILRLDVVNTTTYTVPPSNPFASGVGGNPLVWDWGLRNPWRFSFGPDGTLYVGDVGQNLWEELDVEAPATGAFNYGWNKWEGDHTYPPGSAQSSAGMTFPKIEYPHPSGDAIVGGYVYTGSKFPAMFGQYFFGDYEVAKVFQLHQSGSTYSFSTLADFPSLLSSFGTDDSGELYYTDIAAGALYHLGDANVYSTRLGGADRYTVAATVARTATNSWANVHDVIICSGDDAAAADPLSASGLAGAYHAPVLLVSAKTTPLATKQAVADIASVNTTVALHVVGGTGSVPSARIADIVTFVGAAHIASTDRVSAPDRYQLAAAISAKMAALNPLNPPSRALVANGEDPSKFFDALSLSPVSARDNAPILLVRGSSAPAATISAIAALSPTDRWAAGGTGTIAPSVLAQLGIPASNRLAGSDRYSTSVAIANKAISSWGLDATTTALAAELPDALTGGTAIGLHGGVMLVTASGSLPSPTSGFLTAHKPVLQNVWVLGGAGSVTDEVRRQIAVIRDAP